MPNSSDSPCSESEKKIKKKGSKKDEAENEERSGFKNKFMPRANNRKLSTWGSMLSIRKEQSPMPSSEAVTESQQSTTSKEMKRRDSVVSVSSTGSIKSKKSSGGKRGSGFLKRNQLTPQASLAEEPGPALSETELQLKKDNERYETLMGVPQNERTQVWLAEVVKLMDRRVQGTMANSKTVTPSTNRKNTTAATPDMSALSRKESNTPSIGRASNKRRDSVASNGSVNIRAPASSGAPPGQGVSNSSTRSKTNIINNNKFIKEDGGLKNKDNNKFMKEDGGLKKKDSYKSQRKSEQSLPSEGGYLTADDVSLQTETNMSVTDFEITDTASIKRNTKPVELFRPRSYRLYKAGVLEARKRRQDNTVKPSVNLTDIKSKDSYERWATIQKEEKRSRSLERVKKKRMNSNHVETKNENLLHMNSKGPRYVPKISTDTESSDSDSGCELRASFEGQRGVAIATDTDSGSSDWSDWEPITERPEWLPVKVLRYTGHFIPSQGIEKEGQSKPRSLLCKKAKVTKSKIPKSSPKAKVAEVIPKPEKELEVVKAPEEVLEVPETKARKHGTSLNEESSAIVKQDEDSYEYEVEEFLGENVMDLLKVLSY